MDRLYQAYYTKCDPILNYMVGKLNLQDGDTVLEPCGGDGVFIDKILNANNNLTVSVFEMNPDAAQILFHKYSSNSNINIFQTDTLLNRNIISQKLRFSKIIGNPPYGAHHDEEIKQRLNRVYKGIYTKESYTLFLYACIQSLDNKGRLSFIIPDTFLFLNRHKKIREFILQNTKIDEILLFPSSFFPGVNFGYANLCIISMERSYDVSSNLNNIFQIKNGFETVDEIETSDYYTTNHSFTQQEVLDNVNSSFLISDIQNVRKLINDPGVKKIGNIADCVTGFYSGNDKLYLHPMNDSLKNASKYTIAGQEYICQRTLSAEEKKEGIKANDFLVPIVKGGGKSYYKPSEWYMEWSDKVIHEYRKSKKCRFQNSDFYFRKGIAVPMIRSSRMTAALMEERLFDQSIVGIFPKDEKWILYLLAFFNSATCTRIISTLNPSANNSANYIKQIPLIEPNEKDFEIVTQKTNNIVQAMKEGKPETTKNDTDWLDNFFSNLYQI